MGNELSTLLEGANDQVARFFQWTEDPSPPSESAASELVKETRVDGTLNVAARDVNVSIHYNQLVNEASSQDILNWLSPLNFRSILQDNLEKRVENTGEWLLKAECFRQWVRARIADGSIIWGTGMPGAGKTMLASIVIEHLQDLAERNPAENMSVMFAYCRYTEPLTVKNILAALVRQTLERQPSLISMLQPLHARNICEQTSLTKSQLTAVLKDISRGFSVNYYILDGLDEALDDIQFNLLKTLSSLGGNFFITSRPLEILKSRLPDAGHFTIEAKEEDIRLLIEARIQENPTLEAAMQNEQPLGMDVVRSVQTKSAGMFLYASLQAAELGKCVTVGAVKRVMEEIPSNLGDAYEATMERINNQPPASADLAMRALLWVVFAKRSLKVEDLQRALAICPNTRVYMPEEVPPPVSIVAVCCGLLAIENNARLIRLIHPTSQEVLRPIIARKYPDPDSVLASSCIAHITMSGITRAERKDDMRFLDTQPLLDYAYHHWATHFHCSQQPPDSLLLEAQRFTRQCVSFPVLETLPGRPQHHQGLSYLSPPLQLASFFDLHHAIAALGLDTDVSTPTDLEGLTPLMLACYKGHRATVQELLRLQGVDLYAVNREGDMAWIIAFNTHHDDVLEDLIAMDATQIKTSILRERPSLLATLIRRGSESVVQVVLRAIDNQGIGQESLALTALVDAAQSGNLPKVQLLLQRERAQNNQMDNKAWSAMMLAIREGHTHVVRELLRSGSPGKLLSSADNAGKTLLHHAAHMGEADVVDCLLQFAVPSVPTAGPQHLDPNTRDNREWTPLMYACEGGHLRVVERLLRSPGIRTDVRNEFGWRALMIASFHCWKAVAATLLACGTADLSDEERFAVMDQAPLLEVSG
ncbi:hypothetical protein BKA70DRAFT_1297030 [Coprinopsis sp. MPI-PUGE-AT-0042]|nr:hypothetical protein BKA70DRAFT_1297030 [Coprinopsis sp. MPI-PUGE-AT-0042]